MALGLFFSFLLLFAPLSGSIDSYLLPDHHPIKPVLDALFLATRPTLNLKTLEEAGFKKAKPRTFTKLIVTSHPALPGYIFKLYLDVQRFHKHKKEHHFWHLRCRGAEKIGQKIAELHLEHLFKIPKKWIYRLPHHKLPEGYYKKCYILVEEDMGIFDEKDNHALWASDQVTIEHLEGLYQIVATLGLTDCLKPDNIPFSYDGKVAFIDTQTFDSKVNLKELSEYLSPANQVHWKAITR